LIDSVTDRFGAENAFEQKADRNVLLSKTFTLKIVNAKLSLIKVQLALSEL